MQFGGGDGVGSGNAGPSKVKMAVKRKTPSELRICVGTWALGLLYFVGEQLERKKIVELVDESPHLVLYRTLMDDLVGLRNLTHQRYAVTRINDLFPVTKNSTRLRLLSRKENAEVNIPLKQTVCITSELADERTPWTSCPKVLHASTAKCEDETVKQFYSIAEKCSKSICDSVMLQNYHLVVNV